MDSINKTVVYNEVTGILLLRTTAADWSIAEAAIETLGGVKIDESRSVASGSARRFKDAADAFAKVITPDARSEAARTEGQILIEQKEQQLKELSRKYGICDQTYYRWKAKYGGLEVSEARRLRQLEDENRRLKHIVAEQVLDIQALKGVLAKKF